MTNKILFILLVIPTILFGQETKVISDKENNEKFHVLKSDMITKHGEYKKFSYNNKLLIKGFYKHGLKDSIWECYDLEGTSTLKYDYSNSRVLFEKSIDKENKIFKVLNSSNPQDTILTRPPIFIGGDALLISEFIKKAQYPVIARENDKSGTVYVIFIVDKIGKTNNYHVDLPIGYGMDEEAIRVFKLLPDNWLPGLVNGQPIDVEVKYPFKFQLN